MLSKKKYLKKKNKRRTKRRSKKGNFFKKIKGKGLFSTKTERKLLLNKLENQYEIEIPNDIIDKIVDYSIKDDAATKIQKKTKPGFIVTLLLEFLENEENENQNIDTFKNWCIENLAREVKEYGDFKICDEQFIKKDEKNLFMMFIVDNADVFEAEQTVNIIRNQNVDGYNTYFYRVKKVKYMQIYGKLPCKTSY